MPWSGGSFTRTNGVNSGSDTWEQDKNEPVNILASRHDAHDEDLKEGIDACVNKDGSNANDVVSTAWLQNGAVTAAKLAADASRTGVIGSFYYKAETPTAINDPMFRDYINESSGKIILPKSASITHLSLYASEKLSGLLTDANLTSGSVIASMDKNGASTSKNVTLTSGHKAISSITPESFAANDELSFDIAGSSPVWDLATASVYIVVDVWGHFTS